MNESFIMLAETPYKDAKIHDLWYELLLTLSFFLIET
jgi:hypothetical protein